MLVHTCLASRDCIFRVGRADDGPSRSSSCRIACRCTHGGPDAPLLAASLGRSRLFWTPSCSGSAWKQARLVSPWRKPFFRQRWPFSRHARAFRASSSRNTLQYYQDLEEESPLPRSVRGGPYSVVMIVGGDVCHTSPKLEERGQRGRHHQTEHPLQISCFLVKSRSGLPFSKWGFL